VFVHDGQKCRRTWPSDNLLNLARKLRPRVITLGVLNTVIHYCVDEVDLILVILDVVASLLSDDVVQALGRLLEDTHSAVGIV
jgi:hypothetical protein